MDKTKKKMIKRMALHYIFGFRVTFEDLATKYEISRTKVGRYLNTELKDISPKLWQKVQDKKEKMLMRSRNKFKKYIKASKNNKD